MKRLIFLLVTVCSLHAQGGIFQNITNWGLQFRGYWSTQDIMEWHDTLTAGNYADWPDTGTTTNSYVFVQTNIFRVKTTDAAHATPTIPGNANLVYTDPSGVFHSVPYTNLKMYDTGNTTLSSTLLQTTFVVTHGLGYTPTSVIIQPKTVSSSGAHYVSAITSTTFTITYIVNIGISSLTWDWVAYK